MDGAIDRREKSTIRLFFHIFYQSENKYLYSFQLLVMYVNGKHIYKFNKHVEGKITHYLCSGLLLILSNHEVYFVIY